MEFSFCPRLCLSTERFCWLEGLQAPSVSISSLSRHLHERECYSRLEKALGPAKATARNLRPLWMASGKRLDAAYRNFFLSSTCFKGLMKLASSGGTIKSLVVALGAGILLIYSICVQTAEALEVGLLHDRVLGVTLVQVKTSGRKLLESCSRLALKGVVHFRRILCRHKQTSFCSMTGSSP
jgi:hypothetical protein